ARRGADTAWRGAPPAVPAPAVLLPAPRRLLGYGYAPVLPVHGVSYGPYGYPPRPVPGIGVGLF
ncbi:hypothetical protein, partial [Methylobacterium crusticola]